MKAKHIFAACLTTMLELAGSAGGAQDDKFASCPDRAAVKKYVKDCLGQNPYNTKEVCEERALADLCNGKQTGRDSDRG